MSKKDFTVKRKTKKLNESSSKQFTKTKFDEGLTSVDQNTSSKLFKYSIKSNSNSNDRMKRIMTIYNSKFLS